MKKVFISQPMGGKTDDEILSERKNAIELIKNTLHDDVEILDSFFDFAPPVPTEARPLWCLGESLKVMSVADVVYFCHGWENARGCKIEHECALRYGIQTIID